MILVKALIGDNLTTEKCEYPTDKKVLKFLKANGSKLVDGPFCGELKYNFPQGQKMIFELDAFNDQPDFVRTYEWFGSGGSASRPIIISEKVKTLIDEFKWRGAFIEEIKLTEKKHILPTTYKNNDGNSADIKESAYNKVWFKLKNLWS